MNYEWLGPNKTWPTKNKLVLKGLSNELIPKNQGTKLHPKKSNRVTISNDIDANTESVSFRSKGDDGDMSDGARSTWNKSRGVAVDAIKAKTHPSFYRGAPKQQQIEYWAYGLEKTPYYLMKLGPFTTALKEMRMRHAKDIMNLPADHLGKEILLINIFNLEKEMVHNNESAAAMKKAAVDLINGMNSPKDANKIINEASVSYDITIANMGSNEYKELEKQRQIFEQSPPTMNDILDPAANVACTTTKASVSNNNPNPQGFQGRGRGRGGARPWRNRGEGNRTTGPPSEQLHKW